MGGVAIAACTAWMLRLPELAPVPTPDVSPPRDARPSTGSSATDSFSLAAFDAPIWVEAPVVVQAPPPRQPPPPPPVRFQLIGIVTETGSEGEPVRAAAIYDPDQDRLFVVRSGETIGAFTIAAVERDRVRLSEGSREVELVLNPEGSQG